jgi:hypothetical protein
MGQSMKKAEDAKSAKVKRVETPIREHPNWGKGARCSGRGWKQSAATQCEHSLKLPTEQQGIFKKTPHKMGSSYPPASQPRNDGLAT